MARPKKLLILGLDGALPRLVQKFSEEGSLPNISRLMGRGVFSRVITTFPPLTAAAWAAITTGAGPGTVGVPSLMVHLPGEPLDEWHTSFDKRMIKVETLWEAARREEKRVALVNWPVTWPLGIEDGVQVAAALNPPFRFFYMPLWDLASSALWSIRKHPCDQVPGRAVQISPRRDDSRDLPATWEALFFDIEVPPTAERPRRYLGALVRSEGKTYDQIVIFDETDAELARLKIGQRSDWFVHDFETEDGAKRGRFWFELIDLAPDASDFRLYQCAINTAEAYTDPPELTEELERAVGPYLEVDDPWAYMNQWVEFDWYLDQLSQHNRWWMDATRHVLETQAWDVALSWVGTVDHMQHVIYGAIDPRSRHYDESQYEIYLDHHRRVYRELDEGVGKILEGVDLDETLVLLISDHGFSSIDWNPYLKRTLGKAGLLSYEIDPHSGEMSVDWSKTKCFPLEPCHAHIFVNLSGRDPHGIVEPEDYEKVQNEIIDALLDMKDPETGERVVSCALRKEEAGTLGIFEGPGFDRIGDVLFALKPQYMDNPFVYPASVEYFDGTRRAIENLEECEPVVLGRHFTGAHVALPADESMHSMLVLAGPGVEKSERMHPVNVIDVAPTLSYLLDWPCPEGAEGTLLQDIAGLKKA